MPCRDDYADEQAAVSQQERLDKITRMLCTLGNAVLDCNYQFEEDLGVEREAAIEIEEWLHDHNERDRKRLAREKAEQEKKDLAAKARKKLTKAERKALGLD